MRYFITLMQNILAMKYLIASMSKFQVRNEVLHYKHETSYVNL